MDAARFSYASPDLPLPQRALIHAIERMTGQPELRRLYQDNQRHPVPGESFFAAAVRQLRLDVRYDAARLAGLPATGPCVIVANHPYGVLDGIVIAWLVEKVRSDFLILTNAMLLAAPETERYLLPVDFSGTEEATRINVETRARARRHLEAGGCIIVFPAGAISTSPDRLGRRPAVDAPWHPFTAQLIQRSEAAVVPVFFAGQNGRLFQIASHLALSLRLSLIFKEVHDRIGGTLPVAIGTPVPARALRALGDRKAIAAELMRRTLALAAELPEDAAGRPRRRRRLGVKAPTIKPLAIKPLAIKPLGAILKPARRQRHTETS